MHTIHEASAAVRAGKITPVDLVEQCLANIDRWESAVNAWVFVDRESALRQAERLTEEMKKGQNRGPLHGIPIGVKDIIDVAHWPTAAGSKQWAKSYARHDADVIRRLRQAGAIFLGKTVTTQYASFDPPVTRNPWNPERTPGGSSSGSAVAVACRMCFAALGTQTGGSIIRPASYCGVSALKPSYGVCSTEGIVPLAHSMDHPGPMARCVEDLRLMLEAMRQGRTPTDQPTSSKTGAERQDATTKGTFRFIRLAGLFHDLADAEVRTILDSVCATVRAKHIHWVEAPPPSGFSEILERHRTVMAVEAAQFHRERLARHPEEYEPNISQLLREGLCCPATEYADCLKHREDLRTDMAHLLEGTVAITPATTSAAPPRATTGDPAFNSPWSYLGLPSVSLPTGQFVDGLPISVQLIGGHGADNELLRAAMAVEEAIGVGPLTPTLLSSRR